MDEGMFATRALSKDEGAPSEHLLPEAQESSLILWHGCHILQPVVKTKPQLHPQYVTDSDGHRSAVILPVEEFEELLEDLNDLAVVAERRDSATIPHEAVRAELKRDGFLSD